MSLAQESFPFPYGPPHRSRTDQRAQMAGQVAIPPEPAAINAGQQRYIRCRHAHTHQMFSQQLRQKRTYNDRSVPTTFRRRVANEAAFDLDYWLANLDL